MKAQSHVYSGTVTHLIYENDDFKIVKIQLDDGKSLVVAKGNFPAQQIEVGSWVSFEGKWKNDRRYGKQLTVTRSPVAVQRWTEEKVVAALTSQGVGPTVRMELLRSSKKSGLRLEKLLDGGDLSGVGNLTDAQRENVLDRWRSLRTYLDAAAFMAEAGIPASAVGRIWSTFGGDFEKVVTVDPWVLVRLGGISFKEADEVAVKLGVSLDSPGRVRGAVLAAVKETVLNGHVFANTGQVVGRVQKMIPKPSPSAAQIAEAIASLKTEGMVLVERQLEPGVTALYDAWHHKIESTCAELLAERVEKGIDEKYLRAALCKVGDRVRDLDAQGATVKELAAEALEVWATGKKIHLTDDQKGAAVMALISPVSLLTGLPGTGKTTTLEAVVSVIRDMGVPLLLTAPTGIAAKRMTTVTGKKAFTVHRAFGAKGSKKDEEERDSSYVGIEGKAKRKADHDEKYGEDWEYGPDRKHPARLSVCDEASMLDLHMLYRLLSSTSQDCRLLFVGDPYQLPSVGAGDVLRDMVKSGVFPHTHLDKIFRQKGTSGIVLASHAVHAGQTPKTDGNDFVLIQADSEMHASEIIVQAATKLFSMRKNFQVLSPRHAGDAGVTNLNQRLRMALNPAKRGIAEMNLAGAVVREGDRIMVVKNDYQNGVFNGDVGKVSRIDQRAKEVEIKIHEEKSALPRLIRYPFKDASKMLRLSYAQTVHKSQGQEYDVIVIPVMRSFGRQLQRNLYYTGITRAKKKAILVGTRDALAQAVRNDKANQRNTFLKQRLQKLLD